MINIETKTFYFGYGDIGVGSNWKQLKFREFKPPIEVGNWFEDENYCTYTSEICYITIANYEEGRALKKLLDSIDGKDNLQFEFKGWIFDFSYYNSKSVQVIKMHLKSILSNYLRCMAC